MPFAMTRDPRTQITKHVAEAFREMLHAIEAEYHAQHDHLSDLVCGRKATVNDLLQALEQPPDDTVNVRVNDMFLAAKMQVNRAFANADLVREIVHRHFSVAVTSEKMIGRIQDFAVHF